MRATRVPSIVLLVTASLLLSACGDASAGPARGAGTSPADAAVLPASLDALFPPRADGPVLLDAMVEMDLALSGLVADVLEQDLGNARAGFPRLEKAWAAARALVPEWAPRWPGEPLKALGTALEGDDPGAVMGAVESLGGVCAACHHVSMVAVQQRYHWGDFASIEVTDPLARDDVSFGALMHRLAGDLAAIPNDLAQGQVAAARSHLEGLRARYETLEESCGSCHASERRYFVGHDVEDAFRRLEAELGREDPDPSAVGSLVGGLGERSCHRCHLVHVPAAFAGRTDLAR